MYSVGGEAGLRGEVIASEPRTLAVSDTAVRSGRGEAGEKKQVNDLK